MSGPPPRNADCHPDRKHCARGYCASCYHINVWRPSHIDSWRQYQVQWKKDHPERVKELDRKWKQAHPEAVVDHGRRMTLKAYGLTPETYADMLAGQGGRCAICGSPPSPSRSLHVDHDHESDEVRSLLCGRCNTGLGSFRDEPDLLAVAQAYLQSWRQGDSQES
jgi:hypothetical protein